jgi:OFA family oxalate/formate antiporter-like MFS transporter
LPNPPNTPLETAAGHDGRWWQIVGGVIMNLAFGNVYAWSVFVTPLERQFGWRRAETATVFTIAIG